MNKQAVKSEAYVRLIWAVWVMQQRASVLVFVFFTLTADAFANCILLPLITIINLSLKSTAAATISHAAASDS